MSARRSAARLLAGLVLVLCTGCQVTVTTGVDANRDGSGVVRAGVGLDRDAASQVPDLGQQLRVDDLRRAGWDVTGPAEERDGLTWVRATRRFSDPAGARKAMAELNGPSGPFQGFRLSRKASWLRTRTAFRGVVDLQSGANGFIDPDLRRRLGGADPGLTDEALQRRAGLVLNRIFRVRVAVRLPGSVRSNAPVQASGGALWNPKLGERAALSASSTSWNLRALVFGVLALAAAVAAVVTVLRRRRAAFGGSRAV